MAPAVVGLTGGIGSGKSEALAAFRRRGARPRFPATTWCAISTGVPK